MTPCKLCNHPEHNGKVCNEIIENTDIYEMRCSCKGEDKKQAFIKLEKRNAQRIETEKILHIGNQQIPVIYLKGIFKAILLISVIIAAFYLGQIAMAEQTRLFIFYHGLSTGSPLYDSVLHTHNLCDIYLENKNLKWNCTAYDKSFNMDNDTEFNFPENSEPLDLPDWR